jgi:hypothetical protein
MGLPRPDGQRQCHRAPQQGRRQNHSEGKRQRRGIDPAEERADRHHRPGAGDQPQDRQQPGAQLAQDDLRIRQVGHHHMSQVAPCTVKADRAGGRCGGRQYDDRHFHRDQREEVGLPERGVILGGHPPRSGRLRPGDGRHRGEEGGHEDRPARIEVPPASGGDPLVGEDRTRTESHPDPPALRPDPCTGPMTIVHYRHSPAGREYFKGFVLHSGS